MLRSLLPLAVAALASEMLALSAVDFRTPSGILFPLLFLIAYRQGRSAAATGSVFTLGYLIFFFSRFGEEAFIDHAEWRAPIGLLLICGLAVLIGQVRERTGAVLLQERSARDEAESERKKHEKLLDAISDGLLFMDVDGRITYLNRSAELLVGRTRDTLIGRSAKEEFPRSAFAAFYAAHRRSLSPDGSAHFIGRVPGKRQWLEVETFRVEEGLSICFRDITEQQLAEERLRSMSLVDELTKLHNRRGFFTLAEQQWKLAVRRNRAMTLIYIDLDNFKHINDTLGHAAGDLALSAAATILRDTFRESDVVGRIGGDEFAGLAMESGAETAPVLLDRLQEHLRHHNDEKGSQLPISLSFGTAIFDPDAPCTLQELIAQADAAMYRQKRMKRSDAIL